MRFYADFTLYIVHLMPPFNWDGKEPTQKTFSGSKDSSLP